MAIFLAGTKLSRMGMDRERSSSSTVADRVSASVSMTSKSSGESRTGHPAARPAHGVVHGAGEIEVERVAELVGLGGLLAVVAGARPGGAVVADPVLGQLGEQVGEGLLADAADALGGQLEPALALVDEPGVGQLLGQLGQAVERAGGVLAEVLPHLVEVDLGQRRRRVGRAQEGLQLVEVPQPAGGVGGLPHAHRLVAAEPVPLVPAGLGEGLLEVAGQPVDLPPEVEVLEERLGQALELGSAARATSSSTWPGPRPSGRPAARAARRGRRGRRGTGRRTAP